MKIFKNNKRKKWLKFKAKTRAYYKKEKDNEVKKIQEEYDSNLDKTTKRHNEQIQALTARFNQELEIVREQTRNQYIPIVNEREQEIQRLNTKLDDQKQYFESVKEREFQLVEITNNTANKFNRGLNRIAEGVNIINSGKDEMDHHNRIQLKQNIKIEKQLRE